MKEDVGAGKASDPVRSLGGRIFVYRSGGWVDTEAVSAALRAAQGEIPV